MRQGERVYKYRRDAGGKAKVLRGDAFSLRLTLRDFLYNNFIYYINSKDYNIYNFGLQLLFTTIYF